MADPPPDTRLDIIAEYSQKSLRLKADRWNKLLTSDEAKTVCNTHHLIPHKLLNVKFSNTFTFRRQQLQATKL